MLTVGSFFPCIYYGFFCDPHYQILYLTSIVVAGFGKQAMQFVEPPFFLDGFLVGAGYIVVNPEYGKPSKRGARTIVFVGLGMCGVIPLIHGIMSHGYSRMVTEMGFMWLVVSGALYLIGALL